MWLVRVSNVSHLRPIRVYAPSSGHASSRCCNSSYQKQCPSLVSLEFLFREAFGHQLILSHADILSSMFSSNSFTGLTVNASSGSSADIVINADDPKKAWEQANTTTGPGSGTSSIGFTTIPQTPANGEEKPKQNQTTTTTTTTTPPPPPPPPTTPPPPPPPVCLPCQQRIQTCPQEVVIHKVVKVIDI